MNLPSFSGYCTLRERNKLPDLPGIYVVIDARNRLLYVGKARNLKKRWAGSIHHRYKQLSRQGLDKITVYYILAEITELDSLEKQYIDVLKPTLNNNKVKKYLPKKSPRFSEIQRLLKLLNDPLFPTIKYKSRNGLTFLREPWDLFRGFIAGIYEDEKPHILVICQQNMGTLVWKSSKHRTKKRFYLPTEYQVIPAYRFDLRQAIVVFVELFEADFSEKVFEGVYYDLIESKFAGVNLKRLQNIDSLKKSLESTPVSLESEKTKKNYLLKICETLKILPDNYTLNQDLIW